MQFCDKLKFDTYLMQLFILNGANIVELVVMIKTVAALAATSEISIRVLTVGGLTHVNADNWEAIFNFFVGLHVMPPEYTSFGSAKKHNQ